MAKVKTLETVCFDHILWRLEEYRTEDLSLLPKKYRVEALLQLPIVDVCRLEDTRFTADIVMDTIWEQLYEKYIGSIADIKPEENWKQSFLSKAVNTILKGGRPYGYFYIKRYKPDSGVVVTTNGLSQHLADNINYLVAMKRDEPHPWQKETSWPWFGNDDPTSSAGENYALYDIILNCYQVTLCEGVVSPGKAYEQGCENSQIVPPRFMTLLNSKSRYLPNLTALELIKKCGFHLKSMDISLSTFGAFLLHAQCERVDFLKFLRKFLSTVESVTFYNPKYEILRGVKLQESIEDSSRELLQQGIATFATVMLKSVSIITDYPEPVIDCITPVLATSPSCLQTFKYESELHLSNDRFQQLQSIILHHNTLKTVSIKHIDDNELGLIFPISWKNLSPWMEISLANQFLQSFNFYLHTIPMDTFLNMITAFLSAPCSQKQTLSLRIIFARGQEIKKVSKSRSVHFCTEQLEKVDEKLLQRKSIEFVRHVSFSPKFNPIRLGGLIATRISSARISTLLHHFISSEVRLNSVNLSSFKAVRHYHNLFQGERLKSIIFSNCKNIPPSLLKQAATEHGFRFEVTTEIDSKTIYTVTKEIV